MKHYHETLSTIMQRHSIEVEGHYWFILLLFCIPVYIH